MNTLYRDLHVSAQSLVAALQADATQILRQYPRTEIIHYTYTCPYFEFFVPEKFKADFRAAKEAFDSIFRKSDLQKITLFFVHEEWECTVWVRR